MGPPYFGIVSSANIHSKCFDRNKKGYLICYSFIRNVGSYISSSPDSRYAKQSFSKQQVTGQATDLL